MKRLGKWTCRPECVTLGVGLDTESVVAGEAAGVHVVVAVGAVEDECSGIESR